MSQDNQDDRDRQPDDQPAGWQQDEQMARDARGDQPETEPIQAGTTPQDTTPAADDLDDMDEDRDDDDRNDGSPNRRNNIG